VQKPNLPGASLTDAVYHAAGGGLPETITSLVGGQACQLHVETEGGVQNIDGLTSA
jgi:hypothetical protein